MLRELHRHPLQRVQRPVFNGRVLDVATAPPRDRNRRLAVDTTRRIRLCQFSGARNLCSAESHIHLQFTPHILRLRAILQLNGDQRIELASFNETGDEGVTVDAGEF